MPLTQRSLHRSSSLGKYALPRCRRPYRGDGGRSRCATAVARRKSLQAGHNTPCAGTGRGAQRLLGRRSAFPTIQWLKRARSNEFPAQCALGSAGSAPKGASGAWTGEAKPQAAERAPCAGRSRRLRSAAVYYRAEPCGRMACACNVQAAWPEGRHPYTATVALACNPCAMR